jgi:hypothetical protein
MASGTESQPGAAPFVISQGQVKNDLGQPAGGSMSRTLSNPRPQEAVPPGPRISGPQTAMQGATILLTVHNPEAQPLSTTLSYDASVLEESSGKASGSISVQVAPSSRMATTLRVKKEAVPQQTELRIDASPTAWPIQIVNATGKTDGDTEANETAPR